MTIASWEREQAAIKAEAAENRLQNELCDELFDRLPPEAVTGIQNYNTFQAGKKGEKFHLYRDASGIVQYTYRKLTEREAQERAEDWVEDNI